MSAVTAPTIPPRPTRAQQAMAHGADRLPEMPPRPFPKRMDRSVSPANYPRSPFNEPYNPIGARSRSKEPVNSETSPRRPSVQNMPSVGQEGMEYADIQYQPISALTADGVTQTRNIAEDLHLHAPKPSLPQASATAQVQSVTKTDTSTPGQEESEFIPRTRSRTSFSRPGSTTTGERRTSGGYQEEQNSIPVGIRVPINPLLGDVQAPSPASFSPNHTGQNGEHRKRPHHFRTKSGSVPPGSYGLHGHGVAPQDHFEKEWYAKHPDQLQHEEAHGHGVYESIGSGRGSFALSSDDLNKIVRNTASRGSGFGTSGNTPSYPDEQIGYLASEQYISRSSTNIPQPLSKTVTNVSQPPISSPLTKASFSIDDIEPMTSLSRTERLGSTKSDVAVDSENEDAIRVDAPRRTYNKVTGGEERMNETERPLSFVSHATDDGREYSVPILASDEVAKEVGGEYLQPAISPRVERRGSGHDAEHRSGDATPNSRPSSRPGSIYGLHSASHSLSRFISHHDDREAMHTPLEDVDEYEPLFPEEEGKNKALSHAERFKQRPDSLRHRFPSQDIWEDTPSSAMYEATVSTPDLPSQAEELSASQVFEPPSSEAARKREPSEEEKAKLVPREERLAKSRFAPHLRDDMPTRPGMAPRFPSQDIWEDSPDSHHLVTTVGELPEEEPMSPEEAPIKPAIPPRPAAKKPLETPSTAQAAPTLPARPPKRIHAVPPPDAKLTSPTSPTKGESSPTELRKVPSIPDRPKPQVPARPAKKISGEALSKTISSVSAESAKSNETEKPALKSPPLTKAKPQIPTRPVQGGAFANVKGNFMDDLNRKLGLGPPKEKVKEPEAEPEEAKPLEDARKGRARGPQRRAPPKASAAPEKSAMSFTMFAPKSLWHIDDGGILSVGSVEDMQGLAGTQVSEPSQPPVYVSEETQEALSATTVSDSKSKAEVEEEKRPSGVPAAMAPALATNTAGELADPTPGSPIQEKPDPMSKVVTNEETTTLSKNTTASSGMISGEELEREIPDPSMDVIPASKQTTATDESGDERLHKTEKKAPEEPSSLRNEQVRASAPGPDDKTSDESAPREDEKQDQDLSEQQKLDEIKAGANKPTEPMPEDDISYKRLEELSAMADGKEHSAQEGGTRKVVE